MSQNFGSIKMQIEAVSRNKLSDFERGQELNKFVDECSKLLYLIAGHGANATYQRGNESNSEIAERLKPLKRDLEIMGDVIDELNRLKSQTLSLVEERLDVIG